jgi:hypothetical protein
MDREKTKKTIVIVSGIAFLGSSITGLVGLISSSFQSSAQGDSAAQSQNAQLLAQEKGYISVLQREPKNPTALKELSQIINAKAQSGDLQGARATIAALVKIEPKNKEYQAALAQIDKDIAKTKADSQTPSPKASVAPTQPPKTEK